MSEPSKTLQRPSAGRHLTYGILGYLAFVVYGSLVPLDFHPHPFDEAWRKFLHIRYLSLGVVSRADWVANIVLYLPLSFLGAAWASRAAAGRQVGRAFYPLIFGLCVTLAVGIEFTQQFFPPRTVSLNDLLAETIGTALGIVLWDRSRGRVPRLMHALRGGGAGAVQAAMIMYVVGYIALSLFPYDFLVSLSELRGKLATDRYGWWVAGTAAQPLVWTFKLVAEVLAVAPLGTLLSLALVDRGGASYGRSTVLGLVLGTAIEGTQLFLVSGVSQGVSVLTRGLGIPLGIWIHEYLRRGGLRNLMAYFHLVIIATAIPYVCLVAVLNGWRWEGWTGVDQALSRLPHIRVMPFYYHYYTSEPVAVFSFLSQFGMYLPIGLGVWGWHRARGIAAHGGLAVRAAIYAAVTALIVEIGKLFLPAKHPDLTDVLIAAFAAWAACKVATWIEQELQRNPSGAQDPGARLSPGAAEQTHRRGSGVRDSSPLVTSRPHWPRVIDRGLALVAASAAVWAAFAYPIGGRWLVVALVGYGLWLWRQPLAWLVVLPAALPTLDLAPWTGRFFLDEFDILVLATLAVGYWNLPGRPTLPAVCRPQQGLVLLLACSYCLSMGVGLFPLQPLDANAFASYYSHYNSLRVAKGFFSALLLWPLIRQAVAMGPRATAYFTTGILLGLGMVGFALLWQRHLFSGVLNFREDFRVTGPFSAMHTGEGLVGAYLSTTLPFALGWLVTARHAASRAAAVVLLAVATYGLLVTFARGAYLGMGMACLITLAGLWLTKRGIPNRPSLSARRIAAAVSLVLVVAISLPILLAPFARGRLAAIAPDLNRRVAHWQEVLRIMDHGLRPAVVGMGLGRFPEVYFWRSASRPRPATFQFVTDDGDRFLRLASGDLLYFGQRVALRPHQRYTLSVDIRGMSGAARLAVAVCEKSLLYSYRCRSLVLPLRSADGAWESHTVEFDSGALGQGPWYARRPVEFTLYHQGAANTVIEIRNVSLLDVGGKNLLHNGNFSHGGDHWFFSSDNHLPWHIKNFWLAQYFEQGALGVIAFVLFVVYTAKVLLRQASAGDSFALLCLASLSAFLTVGLFSSLFEFPRYATLVYLLVLFSWSRGEAAQRRFT